MRFQIRHEGVNRIRIHFSRNRMSCREADTIRYFLEKIQGVYKAEVQETTCDAVVCYRGGRRRILKEIYRMQPSESEVPAYVLQNSDREMTAEYKEKLVTRLMLRFGEKMLLPAPARAAVTVVKAVPRILEGARTLASRRMEVPVLDAAAIGVSILRRDYDTAGAVLFLLGVGDLLEEWTHKKSVGDLARTMAIPTSKAWLVRDGQEILVPVPQIRPGDEVVVRMGNVIPFDGDVIGGKGSVNQAGMTGESLPAAKECGSSVFAGTVLEDGELRIRVRESSGSSRYEKIIELIEESERLKSGLESRAEHLADRLVPWTFAGTGLTWLLTGNTTRALSVLMVDFSCALKLAMPVSVLAAIREAGARQITVKGGRFLEQLADADTIVFDKTGTLTRARPRVREVISFSGEDPDELLRVAACLEEHFPHSMAKAVVEAARDRGLDHEEMHSKVEYLVAHGIVSDIDGKRVCIGSYHFIFEDEGCVLPEGQEEKFASLPASYSHLYLAAEHHLAGVILVEDPLREEAADAVRALKQAGFTKTVMMTGDNLKTAERVAVLVGVDEFYAEVLPEDKAGYLQREKEAGHTVVMVGDGINDSPALSAADVGIAISDGAEIAREIADITISADDLRSIVVLKTISNGLMRKIHFNYRFIVGFNSALIALGVLGILPPAASALLHNSSTLAIGLKSMGNILP